MDLFDTGHWDDGGANKKLSKQLCSNKGIIIPKSNEYLQLAQSSFGNDSLSSTSKLRKSNNKKKVKSVHFDTDQGGGQQSKKIFLTTCSDDTGLKEGNISGKGKKKKRKGTKDQPKSDNIDNEVSNGKDEHPENMVNKEKSSKKQKKKKRPAKDDTSEETLVPVAKKRKHVQNSEVDVGTEKQICETGGDSEGVSSNRTQRRKKKKNKDNNKYKHLVGLKSITSQFHLASMPADDSADIIHSEDLKTSPSADCKESDRTSFTISVKKDRTVKNKTSRKSKLKEKGHAHVTGLSNKNEKCDSNHKKHNLSFDISKLKSILNDEKDAVRKIDSSGLGKDVHNSSQDHPMAQDDHKERSVSKKVIKDSGQSVSPKPLSLADKMKEQLRASRFRYLNEQLYTRSGSEAFSMMQDDPDAFQVYHAGFQSQVTKWPENPVDRVIDYVKKLGPSVAVADFGCGDAKLATSVPNKVHSFDLIAVNKHVTACDMAEIPLGSGSVDVAVFCLALMGTNLADFISEANRVLKKSGILLVAEVVSRFEKIGSFVSKMSKMGFTLKDKDSSNKMFVWFEFHKTGKPVKDHIPHIELAPCIYKRR